jgi:chromosome segregation ATPase
MTERDTVSFEPKLDTDTNNGSNVAPQADLKRVREIIFGTDSERERFRGAEADRLREILFGAQIEEYERRFGDMRRELERSNADLRQAGERLSEIEKTAARRIDALELNVRKMNDELRHEAERQRSRDALLQQLASQVRQHDETIAGLNDALRDMHKAQVGQDSELRSVRSEMIDARDQYEQRSHGLRREIRQAEDTLRDELRRIADRLEYQKTDRKALASMLIEIATRLETGHTVTGMLEGLTGTRE